MLIINSRYYLKSETESETELAVGDSNCRNAIEMYNGEFFDARQRIGEITVNSTLHQRRFRYQTGAYYDTMGIRVTSSPAFGDYGFIAEVITLPQSPSERPEFGMSFNQIYVELYGVISKDDITLWCLLYQSVLG